MTNINKIIYLNKIININMEKIIERLQKFVNQKGGVVEVAEKLGKHPNKFYVMFRGETKPNSATIHELKLAYPDLDLNWLYTGVDSSNQEMVTYQLSDSEAIKENKILKDQLIEAKQTIEDLKEDKRAYRQMIAMYPDKESFPKAVEEALGLQVFVDETMNRTDERKLIGFRQKQAAQSTAKNAVYHG